MPQVDAMKGALEANDGKTLAFCRSGTRSTLLWALARVHMGDDPDAVEAAAAEAGYDLCELEADVDEVMEIIKARPPIVNLMATIALEHYTAIVAPVLSIMDAFHMAQ